MLHRKFARGAVITMTLDADGEVVVLDGSEARAAPAGGMSNNIVVLALADHMSGVDGTIRITSDRGGGGGGDAPAGDGSDFETRKRIMVHATVDAFDE